MQNESPLVFPKAADRPRLETYKSNDILFSGDHFTAFSIKGEKEFTERYKRLRYIVVNFAGLISRVMADMLFSENLTIQMTTKTNQEFVDNLIEDNSLLTQLYESALGNSRRGDSVFVIRIGQRNPTVVTQKSTIIIEEIDPAYYFPVFDQGAARYTPTSDVLAWTFEQSGQTYLHKETHKPGYIFHEVYKYDPKAGKIIATMNVEDFGYKSQEETKIERSLVFHIPNIRDGKFFGTSDYSDLITLFYALNNRITKIDNILDKHSDPILAVPPGVIDEKGKIKKEALGMFEVDNQEGGFNKPEYIVWNANLDAAENQIDKLLQMMMLIAELSPAAMGLDKEGLAESGRALKFKLLATIRKRNRKRRYYDQAIKDIIEVAQALAIAWNIDIDGVKPQSVAGKSERPKLIWPDGIINDETEVIDNEVSLVDAGLSSRAESISRIRDITPNEAAAKVKEIDAENGPKLPLIGATDENGDPIKTKTKKQPVAAGA